MFDRCDPSVGFDSSPLDLFGTPFFPPGIPAPPLSRLYPQSVFFCCCPGIDCRVSFVFVFPFFHCAPVSNRFSSCVLSFFAGSRLCRCRFFSSVCTFFVDQVQMLANFEAYPSAPPPPAPGRLFTTRTKLGGLGISYPFLCASPPFFVTPLP